jgi:hypothetical protein
MTFHLVMLDHGSSDVKTEVISGGDGESGRVGASNRTVSALRTRSGDAATFFGVALTSGSPRAIYRPRAKSTPSVTVTVG